MTPNLPTGLLPALLIVAPNGARKTRADHPAVPLTADDLGRCAARCAEAGAAMIHLHVREADGRHSLDPEHYRAAIAAVRREAGSRIVIQATSEAAGRYQRLEQMAAMRALKPEACSLAIREILPDATAEAEGAAFLADLAREGVAVQYILYSDDDVRRFRGLQARGIVPQAQPFVLFVLGRYSADQQSRPADLLPFLAAWEGAAGHFAVCAFGRLEGACALTALSLGGHARVGFENNLLLADGGVAADNAALVKQTADQAMLAGRRLMTGDEARAWLAA